VALALIDVQMPGMDGFELAELMRGTERTRRIPIIFLTAAGASQQRRFRGYEAGAVDFLHKPIEADVLRSKAEVFYDLYRQRQEVARQRDELRAMIEENSRLLEESRQFARMLQEVDRRKDEFLATLAHELRNPLAPILNAAQILQLTTPTDEEFGKIRGLIERQVRHMARLVDDLLDVSRITSGKIELQKTRINLNDVIENAIETSQPLVSAGGHKLVIDVPSEPLYVEGDLIRLTQVLSNLINNAAKYTASAGEIFVCAKRERDLVVVSVRDTGVGIPKEMLGDVFNMFTQINRHLGRSQGGLGIGLGLVKRLVEMHGGTVNASSEGENRGAEFVVRLPSAEKAAPAVSDADPDQHGPLQSRKVLVVDDNQDAAESLGRLLVLCGHEVLTSNDGTDALKVAEVFCPAMVILDLGMPGMDGFETARRLREQSAGENLFLVALSGWGQDHDRSRTKAAGFNFHLVKPIDAAAVQRLIHSADAGSTSQGQ